MEQAWYQKKNSSVLLTLHQFTPTLPLNRLKHRLQSAVNRIVPQFSKHQPSIGCAGNPPLPPPGKHSILLVYAHFCQKKENDEKGVNLTFFKLFAIRIRSFSFFFSFGPNPDTQGDWCIIFHPSKAAMRFAATPWPNGPTAKKMSHRSGSVSPVFSPIFLECYNDYNEHKTHQNLPRLQKIPPRFCSPQKMAKRTKNCRFQATHSLPWPKSAPPFSVPTNER